MPMSTMTDPLLSAIGVTKRFGGLVAVDQVALALRAGTIHAVIGPNGAGKSTLANMLSGELRPSSGTIRLRGEDVTGWPANRVAQRGLARTFQHTHVFAPFTAFENCRLAAQAHAAGSPSCFRAADRFPAWNATANEVLAAAGLSSRSRVPAAQLSHGERRALDIAMALATRPSVLLLDEPLAGMGPEEASHIVSLLGRLAADHAILLIEHDMDAVFALAQQLTVMANGRVLATGTPEAIRANAEVQEVYLGSGSQSG
jgi:branched-chain amino acid transport system ATP-binding protein